ncbi:glucan endo-1,3-beta-glucosidase 13-like isoform X1 [Nicotiana tabacum]|uniref:Glucan endo-1,3-beta-glucosidase 13-like isoform X1 n=2 Tax=Nicotiana TaxID=4085 RepID=A0AC58RQC6_TOBAC|nr:PREDICTED: glucan endo-1,3-beta-glucosidase 13-like [Nicotiana sylvestris]
MATFTLLSLFILLSLLSVAHSGSIGINYGRIANNLPPPAQVVQLLKTQGVNRVKLYDTDSNVLTALSGSNISVTVALPNEQLADAAGKQSFTDSWVQSNILTYYPKTQIESIAVGNEVFVDPKNTTKFLVPAMKNMYASLVKYGVAQSIKVSSPVALSALGNSYPSSAGSFKPDLVEPVIKPMLSFLKQTGSYLMVNIYPFFAYAANTDTISLDYALFKDNKGVTDPNNGLVYKSLFEAQIDAVYAAMKAVGFGDVAMAVSETGWPSKGDENEAGAGADNAAAYNGNLVRRVLTGSGTPLKPNEPLDVFLFALFNENQKPGPTSERNYGLFYPNEQKVYDITLTKEGLENGPTMNNGSKNTVVTAPEPAAAPVSGGDVEASKVGNTWCVANEKAAREKLQAALDYACGEGGADCRPIQQGATCYDPDTLEAHASYAFNSYYQKNTRGVGTCDFNGAAYVVTQHPKYGSCKFPTGY